MGKVGIVFAGFIAAILISSSFGNVFGGTTPSEHTTITIQEFKHSILLTFSGSNHNQSVTFDGRERSANSTATLIERNDGSGWITLTTVNGTSTFEDESVVPNTAYSYRFSAQNATGTAGAVNGPFNATAYGGGAGAYASCPVECIPPTLGLDPNGNRVISGGFTYNGDTIDVQTYFTPMALVTVEVGEENLATLKIIENTGAENITHVELGFGLAYGNLAINESTASIYWDKSGILEEVTLYDPENALENVRVESSFDDELLTLDVYHTFRQPLDFNMLGTYVWDVNRNGWQNYYNHGVEITGESLNPPKQYEGIYKGHIYHLVEVEKNRSIDEYGNMWTFTSGQWIRDYVKTEKIDSAANVLTRNHDSFNELKQEQIRIANEKMQILCPTCSLEFDDLESSFSHEFIGSGDKLNDPLVLEIMESESSKAKQFLDNMFSYLYDTTHGKSTQ